MKGRYVLFVFCFILPTTYTVGACALTSILPSLSLINMIHCTPYTKATPASVQVVGVDFYIDMDFSCPQRSECVCNRTARFHCVFGSTDLYGVSKYGWVAFTLV
jgi:hypothetical protein